MRKGNAVVQNSFSNQYEYGKIGIALIFLILCVVGLFGIPSFVVLNTTALAFNLFIVCIGFAIGCYGTLIGIGGGPLIIPLLSSYYGWGNEFLVATSTFIVFLNVFSGTLGYATQKRIDYRGGIKFAIASIPGAMIMGYIHHLFTIQMFDVIFGVFLIFLAIYSWLCIDKIDRQRPSGIKVKRTGCRHISFVDGFGETFNFYSNDTLGIALNALLGFLIGFLGIGGGIFQVPILIFLLNYPTHIATATSHFITTVVTFFALMPHIYLGNIYYAEAVWMGLGVILGAQAGAKLAPIVKSKIIIYLFIVVLIVLAIKMLF